MPDQVETVAEAVEVPSAAVADTMDEAADVVTEAATEAADEGNDALAQRLNDLAVELRGHLQHHENHDANGNPTVAVSESVETPVVEQAVVAEAVVKPKRPSWFHRLPRGL